MEVPQPHQGVFASHSQAQVKLEPADDVKDLNELFESTRAGNTEVNFDETTVIPASNLWSFLVTRAR